LAATVIIPARLGSTRFPAKILASDTGKPLVQHVVDRARLAQRVDAVIVATDDQRIVEALAPFETRCMLTSPLHQSGTDRIAEVALALGKELAADAILVNVQGDEPEIEPSTIDALIKRLDNGRCPMATAATPFPPGADVSDPNLVKVAVGIGGQALYFSRAAIPFCREPAAAENAPYYLHQGIYAYTRNFLQTFSSWRPTPLEMTEKLEQLRVLEHGRPIDVVITARPVHGIDTPAQYAEFVVRYRAAKGLTPK
jgi:3-deoxy-manno-octulosonate cytidylyltransferase (CMP-KDO synthetase)